LIEDDKILAQSDEDITIFDILNHIGVQVKQHSWNPNIMRVRVGDAEWHDLEVVQKIPFSQETRKTVVLAQWNGARYVWAKGAPEAIQAIGNGSNDDFDVHNLQRHGC
jgi:magnesium-transporting ATPase (P-type)